MREQGRPAPKSRRTTARTNATSALTILLLLAGSGHAAASENATTGQPDKTGNHSVNRTSQVKAVKAPPPGAEETTTDLTQAQWYLGATNATWARGVASGKGVTVALIDSGITPTAGRNEFAGRVLDGAQWKDGRLNPVTADNMTDPLGHGTHVGGIIAASNDGQGMTGIAPEARILPIDISQAGNEEDFTLSLIDALEFAAAQGADIANISAGFSDAYIETKDYAERLCETVEAVTNDGLLVVASAGNDGGNSNLPLWPAGCKAALTVAALTPTLEPAEWSSFDYSVDISAPGTDILSTVPAQSTILGSGQLGYALASGTSMSAPIVSGAAALLREQNPQWTAQEISEHIVKTAKDVAAPGPDTLTGAGAIDIARALGISAEAPKAAPWVAFGTIAHLPLGTACEAGCLHVHWKPYSQDPESVELTIYAHAQEPQVHTYSGVVRANLTQIDKDAWIALSATYPNGQTVRLPAQPISDNWGWPEPVKPPMSISITRNSDHSVTLRWSSELSELVTKGRIDLMAYMPSMASISSKIVGKVHLKPGSKAKGAIRVKLPQHAQGLPLHAQAKMTLSDGRKLHPYSALAAEPLHPVIVIAERIGNGWVIEARLNNSTYAQVDSQCRRNYTACRGISATMTTKTSTLTSTYSYGSMSYATTEKKLPTTTDIRFSSLAGKLPRTISRKMTVPLYLVSSMTFTRKAGAYTRS